MNNFIYESLPQKDRIAIIDSFTKKIIRRKRQEVKIIDLGCGFGHLSVPLLRLGYLMTCVDISKKLLKMLDKNLNRTKINRKKVKIINKNIEKLPTTEKFDVVLCTEVIEHVLKPNLVVKKISLLLEKRSLFILSVPNGFGTYEVFFDWPLILLRRLLKIKTEKGYYHVNFFTLGMIKNLLEKNNFEIVCIKKRGFFPILPKMLKRFELLDLKLAEILPSWLVNDWIFIARKKE